MAALRPRRFALLAALTLAAPLGADQIEWEGRPPLTPDPYTGALQTQHGPSFGVLLDTGSENGRMSFKIAAHSDERLAGYRIHYGSSSGNYTSTYDCGMSLETACTITGLTNGQTWYFAATAYAVGITLESDYSTELSGQP